MVEEGNEKHNLVFDLFKVYDRMWRLAREHLRQQSPDCKDYPVARPYLLSNGDIYNALKKAKITVV